MNTTITLDIELTERQMKVLPNDIVEELYKACDKRIGELMIGSTRPKLDYVTASSPHLLERKEELKELIK